MDQTSNNVAGQINVEDKTGSPEFAKRCISYNVLYKHHNPL